MLAVASSVADLIRFAAIGEGGLVFVLVVLIFTYYVRSYIFGIALDLRPHVFLLAFFVVLPHTAIGCYILLQRMHQNMPMGWPASAYLFIFGVTDLGLINLLHRVRVHLQRNIQQHEEWQKRVDELDALDRKKGNNT